MGGRTGGFVGSRAGARRLEHRRLCLQPKNFHARAYAERSSRPSARRIHKFAFVPCVYYKQATPTFAKHYGEFLDGILFPYRSESTTAGFRCDAGRARSENTKAALRPRFPIIVDIYATRHSRLGPSTPEYVEQVMKLAYPVADGVHIYQPSEQDSTRTSAKSTTSFSA